MSGASPGPHLLGRQRECDRLTALMAAAKAGRSQILVVRAEAGMGKTALLDFLVQRSAGCRVARTSGVELEMELGFAGLHQLCSPLLDRVCELPDSQQETLGTAFGLRRGSPPDHTLVGEAVLALLREVARERPLICVLDDAQWLDQASVKTLESVAGRLAAEPVAMVFAVRVSDDGRRFAGLPDFALGGLDSGAAAALLESAVAGPLDHRVRDRILAECQGNPLALLELPRRMSAAELAFGGGTGASPGPVALRLEQEFLRQVRALREPSRQLLLIAAAEPVGDGPLLCRAAERLGIGAETPAEVAGLIEVRSRVRFRHPFGRSAVYGSATPAERREVHRALADVTDADVEPDRRAWHRAHAAVGPDEAVAAELVGSAGRALSQGGLAAAAAFLDQAVRLTPEPARRARRSLGAGQAKVAAGDLEAASALLAAARIGPLGETDRARMELVHAHMSLAADRGDVALPLFLDAARRLERLDPDLARDAYLDALSAALSAGRRAGGPGARQVAKAAQQVPPPGSPRKGDVLLQALGVRYTEGYAAAAPISHRAVRTLASGDLALEEVLRSGWLAAWTAASLWDDADWDLLTRRHLDVARKAGALSALPLALTSRVLVHLFTGDLTAAESLVREIRFVAEITGGTDSPAPCAEVCLAAVQGGQRAERLTRDCLERVAARGGGVGVTMMQWARAVLCNGVGRYADALEAAREAVTDPLELGPPTWALAELVEAGVRSGHTRTATDALERLSAMAHASGTDWALGIEAGRRALLRQGPAAEELYQEAVDRLSGTRVDVELARTRLLYGEWLRREGRRVDARAQLRIAHLALTAMGVGAFAERARHELLATGATARKRTAGTPDRLTAQEAHVARLAADGLTNPEIGAALYISSRTVEWHLRKVFIKRGIGRRRELRRCLADADRATVLT